MKATGTLPRLRIALVAAVLMLVQSVASSFAGAAEHPALDAFGNPLCITSTDHDAPQGDHGKLAGCCTLSCGTLASPLLPPPDKAWFDIGFDSAPIQFAPLPAGFAIASDDHRPGSPRAPPVLV